MISKPKLVTPQTKGLNLKTPDKGNARFIMGLNNRVAKLDKRVNRLEGVSRHLLTAKIGYKELFFSVVLSLLIMSSYLNLAPASQDTAWEKQLISIIQSSNSDEAKSFAAQALQSKTQNESLIAWLNNYIQLQPSTPTHLKWPLEGYDTETLAYQNYKKGIHIDAKLGDPVLAIADGTVVYSGDGLAGYGNLILIQHDQDLISVYGNNYSNYVKKGEVVKQGQLIAAVGESTGNEAKLYFEIRYEGQAQDPFLYYN